MFWTASCQIVVDAEHRLLWEDAVDRRVELTGALQVVAERLLDDHPAPAALLLVGQAGLVQLLAHHLKRLGRDGQIERVVAADAPFSVQFLELLGQPPERSFIVEGAPHEADAPGQPVPHLLTERRAGVLLDRVVDDLAEILVGPVPSGEPNQCERGWKKAPVGQVVDRRHQLLAGEIARDTEDHHTARARDARHPLVALVPQGITPAGRG